jgi:hypothetical protein
MPRVMHVYLSTSLCRVAYNMVCQGIATLGYDNSAWVDTTEIITRSRLKSRYTMYRPSDRMWEANATLCIGEYIRVHLCVSSHNMSSPCVYIGSIHERAMVI